ncbi:MAG TPA: hypothetical protein PK559_05490 [Ignavibacteriaceae bacterium]|nr:hypothetical protein [Ignavibacteriaceae bacterium]
MKNRIIFTTLKLFVWVSLLLYNSISFPQFKPGGVGGDNINVICGKDDREPSDNAAVGRLLGIDINDVVVVVGTAFVLNNGLLVSAGHIKTSTAVEDHSSTENATFLSWLLKDRLFL